VACAMVIKVGIYSWGSACGCCGLGNYITMQSPLPVCIFGIEPAFLGTLRCAAGRRHTMLLLPCGALWSCGNGETRDQEVGQCLFAPVSMVPDSARTVTSVVAGDSSLFSHMTEFMNINECKFGTQ